MGSARTVSISDFKERINLELRNKYEVEWEEDEVLAYLNKWLEFIYSFLAEHESDLVMTGSGSFTTEAGTERYALSSNSMGDLWFIPCCDDAGDSNVRLSGVQGLELVDRKERAEHLLMKDQGTSSYSPPTGFYLHGDYIGLLPIPDDAYTVYVEDYVPEFTPLTSSDNIPLKNLFNLTLEEGVKIIAKNRENYGTQVDVILMELFQERAISILRKRQKQESRLIS